MITNGLPKRLRCPERTRLLVGTLAALLQCLHAVPGNAAPVVSPAAAAAFPVPAPAVGAAVPISLDAALAAADDANIDLVSARNALGTARANLRSADTAPNPVLSLSVTQLRVNRLAQVGLDRISNTAVSIDMPLERGGKRRARVAGARAGLEAAGDDVLDGRRQIHAAVGTAYYGLLAAERRQAVLTGIAASYAQTRRIADKRLAAGDISGGDRARQAVEALRADAAVSRAISDRRQAQLALAILIGRETDAPGLVTLGDWPATAIIGSDDPEDVADRRPDVRAAAARVDAARRNLDGAHALRHPDMSAGVQYDHDPQGLGSSIGFGVSIPLPLRNPYNGEVDAAGVALANTEALAAKIRAVAIADIITARRAATEAVTRAGDFDSQQLPAARKSAATAEFAYARGALSLLELLDARRTLQAVELDAIDAHDTAAAALSRLHAAESAGDE